MVSRRAFPQVRVARSSDGPVTGRVGAAGSYEVTYVAWSTVMLWWPAGGRDDGSFERHFAARNISGQTVPLAGWFLLSLESSEPSRQTPRNRHARHYEEHLETSGMQISWARPFHLRTNTDRRNTRRS